MAGGTLTGVRKLGQAWHSTHGQAAIIWLVKSSRSCRPSRCWFASKLVFESERAAVELSGLWVVSGGIRNGPVLANQRRADSLEKVAPARICKKIVLEDGRSQRGGRKGLGSEILTRPRVAAAVGYYNGPCHWRAGLESEGAAHGIESCRGR